MIILVLLLCAVVGGIAIGAWFKPAIIEWLNHTSGEINDDEE